MGGHYDRTFTALGKDRLTEYSAGLFFVLPAYTYPENLVKRGCTMEGYNRNDYVRKNGGRRSFDLERKKEPEPNGTVFLMRFFIAASLLLCFLLSSQFASCFLDGMSERIYEEVIDNDFYTKLQNYVMMILYD